MRLQADGQAFQACYPEWGKDVAALVASDTTQATFGIFGRWGAGKSSACSVIKDSLINISTQRERYIGIIEINLVDLQGQSLLTKLDAETRALIGKNKGGGPKLSKGQVGSIAKLFGRLASYGGDYWAQANALELGPAKQVIESLADTTVSKTVEKILEPLTSESDQKATDVLKGDQIVFFLDDLDRCYPDKAVGFLALAGEQFHKINPDINFNLVIACDPEVLGRHAAHVFGISFVEGMEAISKYIHIPLIVPIAATKSHPALIARYIPEKYRKDGLVMQIIQKIVGVVPIRELLAALPQTFLWHQRAVLKQASNHYAEMFGCFLFWSLVSFNLPAVARHVVKDAGAGQAITHLFDVKQLNAPGQNSNLMNLFGEDVLESVKRRPDLCRVASVLLNNNDNNNLSSQSMPLALSIVGRYD